VVGRAGEASCADGPALPDVSSTEVRERLRRGEEVSALVPTRVLEYIRERDLYRE
jgi:nicotinic acid mononucleotide adenylyltransferase